MALNQHNWGDKSVSTLPTVIKNLHNFVTLNYSTQPVNLES